MGDENQVSQDTSVSDNGDTTVTEQVEGSSEEKKGNEPDYKTLANNYKIRAEKAEAKLKEKAPAKPEESSAPKAQEQKADLGLVKLYAKGLEDDQVAQVQKIAALEGTSLDEAFKSELYTTWNSNREAKIKAEQAQLRASNGSKVAVKKGLNTPGLSDEEHKALYKQKYG
jgi:hypothetical protein